MVIRSGAEEHGIPGSILRWIMIELEVRTLSTEWQGCRVEGNMSEGCPYGGVLFPLLVSLVFDSSLRQLYRDGVSAVRYADDI